MNLNEKWANVSVDAKVLCRVNISKTFLIRLYEFPCTQTQAKLVNEVHSCQIYEAYKLDDFESIHKARETLIIDCTSVDTPRVRQEHLKEISLNDSHMKVSVETDKAEVDTYVSLRNHPAVESLPDLDVLKNRYHVGEDASHQIYIFAENSKISKVAMDNLHENLIELRLADNFIQEIEVDVLQRLSQILHLAEILSFVIVRIRRCSMN